MKKVCFLAVFLGFALIAANAQSRLVGAHDPNASAGAGQSEIIINAENSDRDIAVWINGTLIAHVRPKTKEKIIVHNGQNHVELADTALKKNNWDIGNKKAITVNSNSNCTVIGMSVRYGTIINLNQSTFALGGGAAPAAPAPAPAPAPAAVVSAPAPSTPAPAVPAPAPAAASSGNVFTRAANALRGSGGNAPAANTIESAVIRAVNVLVQNLPANATVAVLSIATNDPDTAEFVIEEFAYLLVDARKFKVVDRKSLDAVRSEARFQISGDVDDNSAVSIGKMLGASIVITGSVGGSGSTRRLRAKALNVQTAEIVTMASEAF